jgi:hypothetical protein
MIEQGKDFPVKEYCSTLFGYILMIGLSSGLLYVGKDPLYMQDMSKEYITPLLLIMIT